MKYQTNSDQPLTPPSPSFQKTTFGLGDHLDKNLVCISFKYAFLIYCKLVQNLVTRIGSKVGDQVASLALPHCLGMPYWLY